MTKRPIFKITGIISDKSVYLRYMYSHFFKIEIKNVYCYSNLLGHERHIKILKEPMKDILG